MRMSDWRPAGGWLLWATVLAGLIVIGVSTVVTMAVVRHGNQPVAPAAVTSTAPAVNPAKQHNSTRPPTAHASPTRTVRTPVYVPPVTPAVTPARSPSPLRTATPTPTGTASTTAPSATATTTAPASTSAPVSTSPAAVTSLGGWGAAG